MKAGKLRILEYLRKKAKATVHRLLRFHVGLLMEEMAERLEFEGECEDEDIPDCSDCEYHGSCPYEPGTMYQAPPGFILLRPGPPPGPHDLN